MSVDLKFTVEDVAIQLLTYKDIRVYRATSVEGSYSQVTDITLITNTFYYSFNDTAGDLNKWYKYSFFNSVGPVESDLSAPFRVDGVTRLRVRQGALDRYEAGAVLTAVAGSSVSQLQTDDYRIKASQFRTDRGKGSWLMPTTGLGASSAVNDQRLVKSSTPTTGILVVEPDFAGAVASGDEVEWHFLADPKVWNDSIVRAAARYWYVERVPIVGVANQEEYNLSILPWLRDPEQVHDVRWYPTSGLDVDQSFGVDGKWWGIRHDVDILTLVIKPAIAATETLYLECTRPMPPLYDDTAAAPPNANGQLFIALAYDEVLAFLGRPGKGSSEDRQAWREIRVEHLQELHRLLVKYRPKPRHAPFKLAQPPIVPKPYSAR